MLSSIFETFVSELQKEENQKQIKDFVDPYLNKYVNFYFYVLFCLLFIIMISSLYTSFNVYNLINLSL